MIAQSFQGTDAKGIYGALHKVFGSQGLAIGTALRNHSASMRVVARSPKEPVKP
jgi:hypothetical protein